MNSNLYGQYSVMKNSVNYREYRHASGDKYYPFLAGVSSYFIPGLGQVYCGEPLRGLAFLSGTVAGYSLMFSGAIMAFSGNDKDYGNFYLSQALLFGGVVAASGFHIWSIGDAVRVAKVKSLYYRNDEFKKMDLSISPTLIPYNQTSLKLGIGLSVNF